MHEINQFVIAVYQKPGPQSGQITGFGFSLRIASELLSDDWFSALPGPEFTSII